MSELLLTVPVYATLAWLTWRVQVIEKALRLTHFNHIQ